MLQPFPCLNRTTPDDFAIEEHDNLPICRLALNRRSSFPRKSGGLLKVIAGTKNNTHTDGLESLGSMCCNLRMYEDDRPFKIVSVLEGGTSIGITSAYGAEKYMLERWHEEGAKGRMARQFLLKCLESGCSPEVARVVFIEAAREAAIFIETAPRPPATGKLGPRWGR